MMTNLSEQLADILNPDPGFKDPEDSLDIETKAKVADLEDFEANDLEDDLYPSSLRKKNVAILEEMDKSYAGKTISRKDLENFDQDLSLEGSEDSEANELSNSDDNSAESDEEEAEIGEFKNLLSSSSSSQKKEMDVTTEIDSTMFESDDDDDIDSESENADDSDEGDADGNDEDDADDSDEDDASDLSEDENEGADVSVMQKFSQIQVNDEIDKGKAVKAQLSMWDSLLECRIKMQKLLLLANQLPQHNTWDMFSEKSDESFHSTLAECQSKTRNLMHCLLDMQSHLLIRNPETKDICINDDPKIKFCTVEKSSSSEDCEIEEEPNKKHNLKRKLSTSDYNSILSKRHKNFVEFRNETIQKWSDKTRIASGKLSNKSFSGFDQSAVKQINQILADKDRLVLRTQLKRGSFKILGKAEEKLEIAAPPEADELKDDDLPNRTEHLQSYDSEIFDDGDFYHHLLRELIERKTADVNNPISLGRQWLEIQKLRGKIKKKVDTKASKGRKIRYNVIPKLVNFMAPVADNSMTDDAKNELFSSLFGKRGNTETSK